MQPIPGTIMPSDFIFGLWITTKMRANRMGSKMTRLASGDFPAPPATPTRRRGVDKSQPGDLEKSQDIAQTQEIDLLEEEYALRSIETSMDDDALVSDTEDSEGELDAILEDKFDAKLENWFLNVAPKLFDLHQTKWNNTQARKALKAELSKTSAPASQPPRKKRKV